MEKEEQNENNEEEFEDVEVWEFALDEEEIDELIQKLNELKTSKTNFEFDIDEDNILKINHIDSEEDDE